MPSRNVLIVALIHHCMLSIMHGGVKVVNNGFEPHIFIIKWSDMVGMVEIPDVTGKY